LVPVVMLEIIQELQDLKDLHHQRSLFHQQEEAAVAHSLQEQVNREVQVVVLAHKTVEHLEELEFLVRVILEDLVKMETLFHIEQVVEVAPVVLEVISIHLLQDMVVLEFNCQHHLETQHLL
jgi:hypothetical protein